MAARTPIPPTTPPTIAPIGVDFFLELELVVGLLIWGPEPSMEADATLETEAKDTLTGLALVVVAPVADPAPG